ncbi:MAG: outer membrane protein assembly factor BamE [Hyphomonadaceae bacterium]
MDRGFLRVSAVDALVLAAAAACAPVTTYSGFSAERNNVQLQDPQPGVDTRSTVMQRFGSPSTTAVFDQTAWYYVSSTQQQIAFYTPRTTERAVMVVRFDGDTVASVEKFGLERGRIVNYSEEVTPTARPRAWHSRTDLRQYRQHGAWIRTEDEAEQNRRCHVGASIATKTLPGIAAGAFFSGFALGCAPYAFQCASTASSKSATMLVILIIGFTAGPAVSL